MLVNDSIIYDLIEKQEDALEGYEVEKLKEN